MQNDVNCCDISLYKILIGVGGVGHGWVGWGGSWWGGVGHGGVGWGMVGHAGVGSYWGEWVK